MTTRVDFRRFTLFLGWVLVLTVNWEKLNPTLFEEFVLIGIGFILFSISHIKEKE